MLRFEITERANVVGQPSHSRIDAVLSNEELLGRVRGSERRIPSGKPPYAALCKPSICRIQLVSGFHLGKIWATTIPNKALKALACLGASTPVATYPIATTDQNDVLGCGKGAAVARSKPIVPPGYQLKRLIPVWRLLRSQLPHPQLERPDRVRGGRRRGNGRRGGRRRAHDWRRVCASANCTPAAIGREQFRGLSLLSAHVEGRPRLVTFSATAARESDGPAE